MSGHRNINEWMMLNNHYLSPAHFRFQPLTPPTKLTKSISIFVFAIWHKNHINKRTDKYWCNWSSFDATLAGDKTNCFVHSIIWYDQSFNFIYLFFSSLRIYLWNETFSIFQHAVIVYFIEEIDQIFVSGVCLKISNFNVKKDCKTNIFIHLLGCFSFN